MRAPAAAPPPAPSTGAAAAPAATSALPEKMHLVFGGVEKRVAPWNTATTEE
jgi:hypothetical protein